MTAIPGIQPISQPEPKTIRQRLSQVGWFFLNNGVFFALIAEVTIFALIGKSKFWNPEVLAIILQTTAAVGIIQPFFTIAMIAGITDFGGAPLAGVLFAVLVTGLHVSWPLALLASMGTGLLVGVLNSWVVLRLKVPPIVTTLITGLSMAGVAYVLAEKFGTNYQVKLIVPFIRQLWTVKPFGLPLAVYLMFALYILVYILLNHTKLGAHLYAIGANPDAAVRSGINFLKLFIFVFILLNITTGLGNIIYNTRIMNAGPYLSPAISSGSGVSIALVASLFAGIGLFGGTGRVEFTLVGLLFFAVLIQGMAVIGFPAQFRVAVDGVAIVSALILDAVRRHLSNR